ncbi:hypothetical protein BC828DRAFT_390711 [Blastocladiella britannica]|nr:hypothetical protein BC828DRAFT_390711 [Blastocladiella britannica]
MITDPHNHALALAQSEATASASAHIPGPAYVPSHPNTNGSGSSRAMADESVMRDHMDRVQSLFLDLVDTQLDRAHATLADRDQQLGRAESDRTAAMRDLGRAWTDVDRANAIVAGLHARLVAAQHELVCADRAREAADRDASGVAHDNARVRDEVAKVTAALSEAGTRIEQMRTINAAFTSDIKIQKRIQSKLKREREFVERQRMDMENELALMMKKYEAVVAEKNEAKEKLVEQQSETRVAQNAIFRMSSELNRATQVRQALEKRWEDSVTAMSKRDATLHAMSTAHVATSQELIEAELISKTTAADQSKVQALLEDREKDLESVRRDLSETHTALKSVTLELSEVRSQCSHFKDAFTSATADAAAERKARIRAEADVLRLRDALGDAHAERADRDAAAAARTENRVRATVVSEQEERTAREVAAKEKEVREMREESVRLHYENAELVVAIQGLREELAARDAEGAVMKSKTAQVTQHAEKLCYESQMLAYRLEKKDMELATARLEQRPADTRPFEIVIQNLEKEVKKWKLDRDKMEAAWLKVQQQNTVLKDEKIGLAKELDLLRTKAVVNTTTNGQITDEVRALEREAFDKNMQMTQLHVELQRLRPRLRELEERNAIQEAELAEYAIQLQENSHTATAAVHLLKHDMRRLSRDKVAVQRARHSDERAYAVLEQKYLLATEILDKTRADKDKLLKQCADLKLKCDMWAKKVDESKAQWRRMVEAAGNRVARYGNGERPVGQGASGDGVLVPSSANGQYEIVDVPGLKLRNETLVLETQHLAEALGLANNKIDQLEASLARTESAAHQLSLRTRQLESLESQHAVTVAAAHHRTQRAERVASFLESQVREARPNTRIDFAVALDDSAGALDPSPALQAVFAAKLVGPFVTTAAAAAPVGGTSNHGVAHRGGRRASRGAAGTKSPIGPSTPAKLPPLLSSGSNSRSAGSPVPPSDPLSSSGNNSRQKQGV